MIQPNLNPCRPSLRLLSRRAALLAAAILLLTSALVPAQETPPAIQNPAEFSAAGQEAFELFQLKDYAGAIAALEVPYKAGSATNVDRALLGTLYLEAGRAAEALEAFKPVVDSETADPAVLFNAGRAAIALGQVETAEQYLERSVAKVPMSPAARQLGLLRSAQGRVTETYRLLRGWVVNNPGDLEARVALIAAGLQMDRAAEVGPLFEGLPAGDPEVDLLRGEYKSRMGDIEGAIEIYEALRGNHPPELRRSVFGLLAEAYLAMGRSNDAVALLGGQTGEDPRLAWLLAKGQEQSGDYQAAAVTLKPFAETALEATRPWGSVAYQVVTDYGRNLAAAGGAEEALTYLRQATEKRPRELMAWKGLGDALMTLGRRDEAQEALDKFRELSESANESRRQSQTTAQDPGTRAILEAQAAMSKGETQRALAILRQEVALSPDDVRPRLLEVRLLLTLQRFQEALQSAEATVARFPDSVDAVYQRGVIHMGMQSPEAAESDLRRALELMPDHLPAMNDLAVVLSLQGKKDEAKALLERLVELNPDNKLALEYLQKMRQRSGG